MTWPVGTKASTTNIDAGSDKPALARPDIKQNIDNVNAIIDEFDIASPNNGDILTYNSSSGAWEPGAASSSGPRLAAITVGSGEQLVSGNIYRAAISNDFDSDSITSITGGGYQFTLSAGTYFIELVPFLDSVTTGEEAAWQVWNETDSSETAIFGPNQIATTTERFFSGSRIFAIADSKTFSFRQNDADINDRNSTPTFKIFKQ